MCDSEGNIVLPVSCLNTAYNQYCILAWQKAEFLSVKFVSLGQWCVWSGLNLKCDVLQKELIDIFVYWKVLHEQQNTGRGRTLHCKMQLCYFSILYALPLWSLSDVIKPEDIKQTRIFFDSTLKNLDKADFFSFFLLGVKSLPQTLSTLTLYIRIFTCKKLCILKLYSYVYKLEYKFRII